MSLRMMTLGERLRSLREDAGYSQRQFCVELLGWKAGHMIVYRWEKDLIRPRLSTLKRIARVYGMSVPELLEGCEI